MNSKMIGALALSMGLMVQSCATTPQGKIIERKGLSIIESPAGVKVAVIKKYGDLDRVCAPREADFAETQSSGANFNIAKLSEGVGEKSTQGALSLGGRDSAVLILREMTYRACELAMNTNANEKEALDIYLKFLKIAQQMIASQQIKGTKVLGLSPAQSIQADSGDSPDTDDSSDSDTDSDDSSGDTSGN